ncbi:MAG: hypothetical protein LW875_08880 [Proteobacteria bacterium]|jgi:ABC-type xylose transport system permease subunit|nr:hypothetical protein [Pseudomonadota bacterium]
MQMKEKNISVFTAMITLCAIMALFQNCTPSKISTAETLTPVSSDNEIIVSKAVENVETTK